MYSSKLSLLARYVIWFFSITVVIMLAVYDPTTDIERREKFDTAVLRRELEFDAFKEVYESPKEEWQARKLVVPDRTFFKDHHVWQRFEIPAAKDNVPEDFVAEFNVSMSRIARFLLTENGNILEDYTRNIDQPLNDRTAHGLTTNFKFKSGVIPRTMFIYQDAATVAGSEVSVRKEADFISYNRTREIIVGLISGIAFGLAIYHAFLAFKIREILYLYYAVFLSLSLGGVAFASGILNVVAESSGFTFTQTCNFTVECFFAANAAFELFQHRFLILEERTDLISRKYLLLHLLFTSVGAVAVLFLNPAAATLIFALVSIPLAVIKMIRLAKNISDSTSFKYLLMNSTYLLGWIVSVLIMTNWLENSTLKLYLFEVTTLATFIVFSPFLSKKIRALEDQRQELIAKLTRRGSPSDTAGTQGIASDIATEQANVAILFVDVVAFSQLASPLPSRMVFGQLSQLMKSISEIIQKHGGIIDRSLGDGLLCFFPILVNDDFGENSLRAFRAACDIQSSIVDEFTRDPSTSKSRLVMPVRIGIHTTQVVIGNLGGEQRVDFTMIGTGVNFASRLEAACTPFRIIVSNSCFEDLKHLGLDTGAFVKIALSVKHQTELVDAYECNPLVERDEDLQKVRLLYFNQLGIEPKETRVPIADPNALRLRFGQDDLQVTDVSINGMKVKGERLFGQRSILQVQLMTKDPYLNDKLQSKLLNKFSVEVRWGRVTSDGFEHGLKIYGGNLKQRQYIFDAICQRFGAQAATTEPTPFDQAS
jgi:class 3 adenylate cyclase